MEAPDFNYNANSAPAPQVGATDAATGAKPIESASASTAPQANGSKFAYFLTAGVLGLTAVLVIALALFVIAALSVPGMTSAGHSGATGEFFYRDEGPLWDEEPGWDEDLTWDEYYGDEFRGAFEEEPALI